MAHYTRANRMVWLRNLPFLLTITAFIILAGTLRLSNIQQDVQDDLLGVGSGNETSETITCKRDKCVEDRDDGDLDADLVFINEKPKLDVVKDSGQKSPSIYWNNVCYTIFKHISTDCCREARYSGNLEPPSDILFPASIPLRSPPDFTL